MFESLSSEIRQQRLGILLRICRTGAGFTSRLILGGSLKGCFYGSQLSFGGNSKIDIYHYHSLHWHFTTHSNVATPMSALTAEIIQVHRVKIW